MVVKRNDLFFGGIWHGLKTDGISKHLEIISKKHTFLSRDKVEHDLGWQQIIPYLVFAHGDKIFLMKRKSTHTDKRLASLYSIGIGGHINLKDIKSTRGTKGTKGMRSDNLMEWARREFAEEIDYEGNLKTRFLGLLNDDSNDVGRVHVGLVIKVVGDSDQITIRDEHKIGRLVPVAEVDKYYKRMETWSQIVYDFLRELAYSMKKSDIVGILPDRVIEEYIAKGTIKIAPLAKNWHQNIDQVSIDFHLGGNIKLFRGGTYRFIDTRRGLPDDAMEEVNLADGDPFILEPGAFAIASTREILKLPPDILGRLEGKSSLARLGILVHSTAARFDPGWNGAPVLELGNLGPKPAILYCGMPICAFTFEKLAAPVKMPYEGSRSDRYGGAKVAVASKIDKANLKVSKRRRRKK